MQDSSSSITFPFNLKLVKQIKQIAMGDFCDIFLVEQKKTQEQYVAKVSIKNIPEQFFTEQAQILQNFDNPAILQVYGISPRDFKNKNNPTIITQYMQKKSLKDVFEKSLTKLLKGWTSTKKYINLLGISLSMKYLHDNEFIFGKLDPSNIFLDENFYPKINPIQMSLFFEGEKEKKVDQLIYVAPEVDAPSDYSYKSDVYSFGFIAYTLFTGKLPAIKNVTNKNLKELRRKVKRNERPNISSITDQQQIDLLNNCWATEPSERCDFNYITDQLLRGVYNKAFNDVDKDEVTKYLSLFSEKDNSLKIAIFPRDFIFLDQSNDNSFKLNISGYQTVSDVIQIIQSKYQFNFKFDLFYGESKLDDKNFFIDVVDADGEMIKLVKQGGNSNISEKPLSDQQSENLTNEPSEPQSASISKKPSSDQQDEELNDEQDEPPSEHITKTSSNDSDKPSSDQQGEELNDGQDEPPSEHIIKTSSNDSDKPLSDQQDEKLTNEPAEPPSASITKKPSHKSSDHFSDSSENSENPQNDHTNRSSRRPKSNSTTSQNYPVIQKAVIKVPRTKKQSKLHNNNSTAISGSPSASSITKTPLDPLKSPTSSDSDKPPKVTEKVDEKVIEEESDHSPKETSDSNAAYKWDIVDQNRKLVERMLFEFPTSFTISDAIDRIESMFGNKFCIKIIEKKGSKETLVNDTSLNVYDRYFNTKKVPLVMKCDIKYKFSTERGKYTFDKRFHYNEKLKQIAQYLVFNEKKQSLSFTDNDENEFEQTNKLKFTYKGKEYSGEDTFGSLDYDRKEKDESIAISLPIPTFSMFYPSKLKTFKCTSDSIPITNIKKIIKKDYDSNLILYNKFELIGDTDSIKKKSINIDENTIIDFFTYQTKIGFKFELKNERLDDYFIYINDSDITFDEIKSMIVGYIQKNDTAIFSPKKIVLKYNGKIIDNKEIYKFEQIEYEPGEFITVSIEKLNFHVKIDNQINEYEIEDRNAIVADLQREISSEKQYHLKFKGVDLKGSERLKNIKTSPNEFIEASLIESRVLTYKGNDYNFDYVFGSYKIKESKQYMQQYFNIDVDNCVFVYGENELPLTQFKKLPQISKIEAFDVKEKKKFNNFVKPKYCDIFNPDQTIKEVREYAISIMKNKYPCCIKANEVYLSGRTNLFKIEGKIEIIKMKQHVYRKTFFSLYRYGLKEIKSQNFDVNSTVSELKKFVIENITEKPFKLSTKNGVDLDEFKFIHEFGEEIIVNEEIRELISGKVTFVINRQDDTPINKEMKYYENKLSIKYKKDMKLKDGIDYFFFSQGKLIAENYENLNQLKDIDDDNSRVVQVYPNSMIYNDQKENDIFNMTAKAALKEKREKITFDQIVLNNLEFANSYDITQGQISIVYDEIRGPKNVFDLRKEVVRTLKIDNVDKVVLFILFSGRDGSDFALLLDDEDVAQIIMENPNKNINYKVFEPKKAIITPKLIKKYKKYAKDHGMELTDQQIKEIYEKVDHDVNMFLSTIDYQSCRATD